MTAAFAYFAYGSNMNPEVMRRHGGAARALGAAVLEGFALRERGHADVEPVPGERVHGVLWELDAAALRALDAYEDVPAYYVRIEVPVRLAGGGGERLAICYRMTAASARAGEGRPFRADYARLSAAGARRFGVPLDPLYLERG